jgi:hypothetical protein
VYKTGSGHNSTFIERTIMKIISKNLTIELTEKVVMTILTMITLTTL